MVCTIIIEWNRRSNYIEQTPNDPFYSFLKCYPDNNPKSRIAMSDAI